MKFLFVVALAVNFLMASVDINNADVKELTTLQGVGMKKAQAIVAYREQHCFKNVSEIVKVKGIGNKFLEKNKQNLKVGTCKK